MNILVTGGAGYIGSHVVKQLLENTNDSVIILDNLSTGSEQTLEKLREIREFVFKDLDLKNFDEVESFIKESNIDAIMHFAASIVVPESVKDPIKYYMNNTVNTTNLIKCASQNGVKKFVFSSTAAVYGEPKDILENGVDEEHETKPINPYGTSKLMSEQILKDVARANEDFKYVIFRYFNVAGADIHYEDAKLSPRVGQSFPNATHLIKIACECVHGGREGMFIFGDDYDTKDGTGVRDYIHVDDLASAHLCALEYLDANISNTFNCGYGVGYSVKEVIETIKKVSKIDFKVGVAPRRDGDPAMLISDNRKILSMTQWRPKYDKLDLICESALEWEKRV